MIQASSVVNSKLDNLFSTWSQADLTENDPITTTEKELYVTANFVQLNTKVGEYSGCDPPPSRSRPRRRCSVPI